MSADSYIRCVADGGSCCGLRHIYNFGNKPEYRIPAYKTAKYGGSHGNRDHDAIKVEFPAQTCKERLASVLEKLRKTEFYGIVQVTLVDGYAGEGSNKRDPKGRVQAQYLTPGWYNQRKWFPILQDHGFRVVNRWFNSNSGNYVKCFQLRMDPAYYKRFKKEQKKPKVAPAPPTRS